MKISLAFFINNGYICTKGNNTMFYVNENNNENEATRRGLW